MAITKKVNKITKEKESGIIREFANNESGINLGGIGTGGVEIWPDGRLHFWNMVNSRPWSTMYEGRAPDPITPQVMDADWFLRIAKKGERPVYRWLFTGHGYACGTASHFWRVHKYFFIKAFPEIRYKAEFPFAYLTYVDPSLPVEVTLRAWTSFIPRDVKNSSIPGCYFDFSVINKSNSELEISLVWQQQNISGYAAPKNVQEHESIVKEDKYMIDMRGSTAHPDHVTSGDMCMWAQRRSGQRVTTIACNPYMQNLIWPIHLKGALDGPIMPSHLKYEEINLEPRSDVPNKGWICIQQKIQPGKSAEISAGLSWYYPNHVSIRGTWVGHMYANWFHNAVEVAQYQIDNYKEFLNRSLLLPTLLTKSESLPESLRLSLLDQISTLTKSSHFIKDGRVGVQEGHGCCCFNTVDVDHYSSYALSILFPEIRKKILEMHTEIAHPKNGKINHGLDATVENIPLNQLEDEYYSRWDVCAQYVLQLYRDTKWAGDLDTMKASYPTAKRAMELLAVLDFYGIGLPYIQGGITYDHWNMQGVVGYMAGVYIAGMRALEEMAKVVGDTECVTWAREKYEKGVRGFEKFLWDGKQYLLYYGRRPQGWKPGDDKLGEHKLFDPVKPPEECMPENLESCGPDCGCHREKNYVELRDTGLMTDLLNGNGTAAVMGLGEFLDPARVRSQLKMIYERNIQKENFCLVNGSYPDGHFLDMWPFMQWQTPWTGTEYFFALMCYAAGMIKEGDHVIDLVYKRHVREGMRFDHAECNNHYARPLCIWGAYAARLGLELDGFDKALKICPPHYEPYEGALVTAQVIGWLKYAAGKTSMSANIEIMDGTCVLKRIVMNARSKMNTAKVILNNKVVIVGVSNEKGTLSIELTKEIQLKKGSKLEITVR